MLEHEYSLRDELNPAWAVRSHALTTHEGHLALVFEDRHCALDARIENPCRAIFTDILDFVREFASPQRGTRGYGRAALSSDTALPVLLR
jgi:hypothetical protein